MANPIHMIYIDASRYSNTGKRTGVENYSYYLIRELVRSHGDVITLISPRKIDLKVKQIIIPFPRLWTLFRLSWEILKNKKIRNLFVPSHVLPLIHPKKSVITIHDVVFKYSAESYTLLSRLYLNWATKFAVKHASTIIVPSRATKKDLVKFYNAEANKIHVVPLGYKASEVKLENEEAEEILRRFKIESNKFFLYIGRLEYKKNTDTLIKAFAEFCEQNKETKLVLAGFPGHGGKKILDEIPAKIKERIILTGYVSNKQKEALLQNALCFVFPSRFEGFGLPLLEAMHAQLPIIASDIPTSKEIAGEYALFFKKEDHQELAGLVEKVSREPKKSMKEGLKLLEKYSWKKCAEEIFQLIK